MIILIIKFLHIYFQFKGFKIMPEYCGRLLLGRFWSVILKLFDLCCQSNEAYRRCCGMEGSVSSVLLFAWHHWSELSCRLLLSMVLERASWSSAGPGNKSIVTSGLTGQVCSVTLFIYSIACPFMDQPGLDWQREWCVRWQTTSQILMTVLILCVLFDVIWASI